MRKTLAVAVLALLAVFAGAPLLHGPSIVEAQSGQNTLTQTTLGADVSSGNNTVSVVSATGITTSQNTTATVLYIDHEELVVLNVSGTQITVSRGQAGTKATPHRKGTIVLAGNPTWFYTSDVSGSCPQTSGIPLATPLVNVINGNQWLCSTITKTWVPGFQNTSSPSISAVTTAVASATTIVPSGPLFHLTGTTPVTTITDPVGCNATAVGGCTFTVIADTGTSSMFGTGGNLEIGAAITTLTGNQYVFVWDATQSKWAVR